MDLHSQLLKEHGRANAEAIADFVGHDKARFAELMHYMLHGDVRLAQRAAFSVGIVGERHHALVTPYLKPMLAALDAPIHAAIPRNVIRLLHDGPLPKPLHGRIITAMFARIAEPRYAIAERAFAIPVAARLVQLYPELAHEFRLVLEDALRHDPGPAIRNRAAKALTHLRQSPATA